MLDFVIVGAGVGGLTLSYYLQRAGFKVCVLECSSSVGGWINTIHHDGFTLEKGPNSTLGKQPLLKLIDELGIANGILYPSSLAKKRFIAIGDRTNNKAHLAATPHSLGSAITTPLISPWAKLRLFFEPLARRTDSEDESVQAFMSRRLGSEFTNTVISSVLSGIWAADISRLSCRSSLPKIWGFEQESGSIIRGAIRYRKGRKEPRAEIITFQQGMSVLPETLAERLTENELYLNTRVESFTFEHNLLRIHYSQAADGANGGSSSSTSSLCTKNLVLTTPATTTTQLLKPHQEELAQEIEKIPYAPVGILHFSFKKTDLSNSLAGFGFLAPPAPSFPLLGAIYSSSLFPAHAPQDQHLLTCFVGGSVNPGLAQTDSPAVEEKVKHELCYLLGASAPPKVLARTYIEKAIPNYALGHHRLQQRLVHFEREEPRLRFLCNWRAGISIADRVEHAQKFAEELTEARSTETHLRESTASPVL